MPKSCPRPRSTVHCRSKPLVSYYDFIWHIDNFPFIMEMDQAIHSASFPAQADSNVKWFLTINPKNHHIFIPLTLYYIVSGSSPTRVNATVNVFMIDKQGNKINEKSFHPYTFSRFTPFMKVDKFIVKESIWKRNPQMLKKNRLTIKCEMKVIAKNYNFYCQSSLMESNCTLLQELGQLLRDKMLSDVTLCLSGKELAAHKAILAARSPMFAAMFRHRLKESTTDRVIITDVSYDVMEQALCYMYTGTVGRLTTIATDLLVAADKYGIEDLKCVCSMHLSLTLSLVNCVQLLLLADLHSAKFLKDCAVDYIRSNMKDVMATDDWRSITKTHHYLELEILRSLV